MLRNISKINKYNAQPNKNVKGINKSPPLKILRMINKFETTTCLEEDKAMFQFQECQEQTNRPVKDHNFRHIE